MADALDALLAARASGTSVSPSMAPSSDSLDSLLSARSAEAPTTPKTETTFGQDVMQQLGNFGAGALRGAGSIGATLLTPVDAAARALGVNNSVIGRTDRRQAMDEALGGMGAQTNSFGYGAGKLTGELAGTAGAGGVAANGVRMAAPFLGAAASTAEALATAIGSSGMRTNAVQSILGNLLTRTAGGAISGGLTAGLVNPADTGSGALIGGALPGAMQLAGKAGSTIRNAFVSAPQDAQAIAQKMTTARAASDLGYVIPPADLQPGITSELLSGLSGKIKTAQVASARNQGVTDSLAKSALGLPSDALLTNDTLQGIRNTAGQAYQGIKGAGIVTTDKAYNDALDKIASGYKSAGDSFPGLASNPVSDLVDGLRVGNFDSGGAIDMVKILRGQADKAYMGGDKALGKATKDAAGAIEDQIGRHLESIGDTKGLEAFQAARRDIAKTYSVQKALNPSTGNVSAQSLATQLNKGKPLSGDLLSIAQFGQAFPKASQALKETPKSFSPLDFAVAAGLSGSTMNPLGLAGIIARPGVRSLLLSSPVQSQALRQGGLLGNSGSQLGGLLNDEFYRAAPLLGSQ